ncbi:Serine carboxypeptidase-like 2 [Platanthera guangdongensis]|uniref:Serine carboxypeptidase-like 2 n=1 Tax=Platanthera guangdongensis TaxID=2320717 RepID=A0ABR2MHT9_9ASPA
MGSAYSSHLHPLLLIVSLLVLPRFLAEAHIVSHLPGFHGALPFRLETGYATIDELTGAQLFYYFIESERNPKEDPLILWLTGGPCCSGLTPLITEIGPIRFKSLPYNASEGALPQIISHPYSWTKISNIIFLDWPVGNGFSFSEDAQDYNPDDFLSSEVIFKFLMKWYTNHHDFFSNPLYIAGDSYGGKLAPIVSLMIAEGVKQGTVQEWMRCNSTMNYIKNIKNNVEHHLGVTKRGYRVLVYSGDHDALVPFLSTMKWIKSLNFSVSEKWRPWRVNGQVAGYTEMYANNLTFATVKVTTCSSSFFIYAVDF